MNGTALSSGQVAELSGVSPDTIRHYERMGILPKPPRTASGYRMYAADNVERVRLVQHVLGLGFTLAELSEIFKERDEGGAPCRRVLSLTEEKLRLLDGQIKELRQTQRYLKSIVRDWRKRLSQTPPGTCALLLNSLTGTAPKSRKARKKPTRRKS